MRIKFIPLILLLSTIFTVVGTAAENPLFSDILPIMKLSRFPANIYLENGTGSGKTLVFKTRSDGKVINKDCVFDLSAFAGKEVKLTFSIRGENLKFDPSKGFSFFNVHYSSPKGNVYYNVSPLGNVYIGRNFYDISSGTFGWREVSFQFLTQKTDDLTNFTFHFHGIKEGTFFIRSIRVEVAEKSLWQPAEPLPENFRCDYSDEVRNHPRLTGIVSGASLPKNRFDMKKDGEKIAAWGVNFIRWWIPSPLKKDDLENSAKYEKALKEELDFTDSLLPEFKRKGIKLLFTPVVPGERSTRCVLNEFRRPGYMGYALFNSDILMERYLELWRLIAKRYKDNSTVWGYDLMNEPFQSLENQFDKYTYLQCQYLAAKAIREIDPVKPIVVSANIGGSPNNYIAGINMWPFPLKNILYQMHFYEPMEFSHNGISGTGSLPMEKAVYPGLVVKNKVYDAAGLRDAMQPVLDFQKKYGALIYMGEFSARRDAKGAAQWLDDVAALADEFGWIWTYHSYGEFHGWNLEYESSTPMNLPKRATKPTDRLLALIKHWRKNPGKENATPVVEQPTVKARENPSPSGKTSYKGQLSLDRADGLYQPGDTVSVTVNIQNEGKVLPAGRKVRISFFMNSKRLEQNDFIVPDGKPFTVRKKVDRIGAYRLCVNPLDANGTPEIKYPPTIGFLAGADKIDYPKSCVPSDFNAWWNGEMKKLNAVPLEVVRKDWEWNELARKNMNNRPWFRTQVENTKNYDIRIRCIDDQWVAGGLSMPKKKGKYPARISFHGYGFNGGSANCGIAATGMIVLDINAHGLKKDETWLRDYPEYPKKLTVNYPRIGIGKGRDQWFFRTCFLRAARAVQFIKSLPEWDGKTLILTGGSQGAAQSIAAAALEPGVTHCVLGIPAMCDFSGAASVPPRAVAWPIAGSAPFPESGYFDCVNFAQRMNVPKIVMIFGLVDELVPATGPMAFYNNLPNSVEKRMITMPDKGHSGTDVYTWTSKIIDSWQKKGF